MGAAQLFSGMWETTIFYNGTEVKVSRNNGWIVSIGIFNSFFLTPPFVFFMRAYMYLPSQIIIIIRFYHFC